MQGYWHCRSCNQRVEIDVAGIQSLCVKCDSPNVHFVEEEPEETPAPAKPVKPKAAPVPEAELPASPVQPRKRSAEWFAEMRALVDAAPDPVPNKI